MTFPASKPEDSNWIIRERDENYVTVEENRQIAQICGVIIGCLTLIGATILTLYPSLWWQELANPEVSGCARFFAGLLVSLLASWMVFGLGVCSHMHVRYTLDDSKG